MSRKRRPRGWVDPEPVRLDPDPRVARFCLRYRSGSQEGVTYDAALMRQGWWSCECWPYHREGRCAHTADAERRWRQELAESAQGRRGGGR